MYLPAATCVIFSHAFSYFHMLSHTFPDFLRLSHKTLSYFSDFRIRLYLISHHFSNFLMFSTLFICPHYFSLSPIHFFNFFVHFHTFSTLSHFLSQLQAHFLIFQHIFLCFWHTFWDLLIISHTWQYIIMLSLLWAGVDAIKKFTPRLRIPNLGV